MKEIIFNNFRQTERHGASKIFPKLKNQQKK